MKLNLADELRHHVRCIAEFPKHLQVTDTADSIPQLGQLLRAQNMQSLIGPYILKLMTDKHIQVIQISIWNDLSF